MSLSPPGAAAHVPAARRMLSVDAGPAAVGRASDWIRALAEEAGVAAADVFRLDLCVSELVSNVVDHAFGDGHAHPVVLEAACSEAEVRVTIADQGVGFDPLGRPAGHRSNESVEQASLGGHGVHLMRQFADDVTYRRDDDRNVVTVVVRRSGGRSHAPRGADRRAPLEDLIEAEDTLTGRVRAGTERRSHADRRALGFISRLRLFRGVPYDAVEPVIARSRVRICHDGEILVRPGHSNEQVAMVMQGRLRVHLESPASSDYIEVPAGECVGEMSVIDGKPVSAWVVAEGPCELLVVDGREFVERLMTQPRVARNLVSMLAERMRRNNRRIIERMKATLELEQFRRELDFSARIQAGMLPPASPLFPGRHDIDCAAGMRAAREVGGDFFDAFFVDAHRLFFAVGDVCGKGLAAALLMVRVLTMLRAEAGQRRWSTDHALEHSAERINDQLAEGNDNGLFVSLFFGLLDTAGGMLVYVNAGHNPPLLAAPDGSCRTIEGPRNPVVGISEGLGYASGRLQLEPGARLVAYTDGVTEAQNAAGEFFGESRLEPVVAACAGRPAQACLDAILGAVDTFTAGHAQSDDITLLVLRRPGHDGSVERSARNPDSTRAV